MIPDGQGVRMVSTNRRWIIKDYPDGLPTASDFELVEGTIPVLADREVRLELIHLSIDPGQRFYIERSVRGVPIGGTMAGWAVGRVVESRSPHFPVGSFARDTMGQAGMQDYAVLPDRALVPIAGEAPLSWHLGALGMPGLTAFFGMVDIGRPCAGEVVLISGTSGSVGSVAAQIARIQGCRTIGIARGAEKALYLRQRLGLDGVIDTQVEDLVLTLERDCPGGMDLFFDNVGGDVLDAALLRMRRGGRIVTAGMMATYNQQGELQGLRNYDQMFRRKLCWLAFSVGDHVADYRRATEALERWVLDGDIRFDEHIRQGIERFPAMLDTLFTRRPLGKMVLQLRDEPSVDERRSAPQGRVPV